MEATATQQAAPPPRLRDRYEQEILPELTKKFGYTTPMQAPRLLKITLNMGLGTEKQDKKSFESAQMQLALIAGQHPNVRRARKSIASFKLREGMPVGVSATLRRAKMWEFFDRLTSIAVPRIRDFRGLNPRSFDGRGNYSMGVKEQLIFPEIDYDSVDVVRGLDVTITTSAQSDLEAFELLLALGMPFAQEGRPGQAAKAEAEAEAEEEQRKEEARLKAEAEQAALEQLKEENPEAYAKPESNEGEGDDAAEGGNDEADQSWGRRGEFRGWLRLRRRSARAVNPSTSRAATTAAGAVGAPAPTTASSASAGSACATPHTRGTSPE